MDYEESVNMAYAKVTDVEKKIVATVEEIRCIAGNEDTYNAENEFLLLARKFCEMKGYEFDRAEYEEVRNNEYVNTKFIAKIGNRYERYVVRDGKLVVSHIFFENLE